MVVAVSGGPAGAALLPGRRHRPLLAPRPTHRTRSPARSLAHSQSGAYKNGPPRPAATLPGSLEHSPAMPSRPKWCAGLQRQNIEVHMSTSTRLKEVHLSTSTRLKEAAHTQLVCTGSLAQCKACTLGPGLELQLLTANPDTHCSLKGTLLLLRCPVRRSQPLTLPEAL